MVKWHPSGEFLVSCSYDNSIKIWKEDVEEEWNCVQTVEAHDSTVWSVDFTLDGSTMISSSDDRSVKIWKVTNPKSTTPKITLSSCLTGYHDRTVFSVSISSAGYIATGALRSASNEYK